jgi:putative phosphoesterase
VDVADTHSHPHAAAAARIEAERPDAILHAGDVGDLAVLADLARIPPVIAVRGNIDVLAREIPDAVTIDVTEAPGPKDGGAATRLRILLLHVGVSGPRLRADAARLARAEGASLVVCGHSHVPLIGRDRDLVVFNPGSIGPRRFHLPIVFGVLEVVAGEVTMRHVDCETGARWTP